MLPWRRYFFRALNKLHVVARNFDPFLTLFAPVVIDQCISLELISRQSYENRCNFLCQHLLIQDIDKVICQIATETINIAITFKLLKEQEHKCKLSLFFPL